MFVSVALTVIAIAMLLFCAGNFVTVLLNRSTFMDKGQMISRYIKPVIGMAASVCLLFNQGGTVAWVFVVTGIIFVIEGILILMDCIKE